MTSKMTDDEVLAWLDMIQRVTRNVCRDFPDLDAEEIEHELWVFILTNKQLRVDHEGCWGLLRREARGVAWDQRKEQLHSFSQYSYTVHDVLHILESTANYQDWARGYVPQDARSEDRMAGVEVRSDVTQAFSRLKPESYQNAILARYRDGLRHPASSRQGKTLTRAVAKLVDLMNFYYTDDKGRRALSNAQARHQIEHLTEGS